MASEGQGSASSQVPLQQAVPHVRGTMHSLEGQCSDQQGGVEIKQEESPGSPSFAKSSPPTPGSITTTSRCTSTSISSRMRVRKRTATRARTASALHPSESLHQVKGEDAEGGGGVKKARSGPKSRTSPYIGVSQVRSSAKARRQGRWEAHIWDSTPDDGGSRGRQLHLGSFCTAIQAARAYDRVAFVLRGPGADLNFTAAEYETDEVVASLRNLSKKAIVATIRKVHDMPEEQEAMEREQETAATARNIKPTAHKAVHVAAKGLHGSSTATPVSGDAPSPKAVEAHVKQEDGNRRQGTPAARRRSGSRSAQRHRTGEGSTASFGITSTLRGSSTTGVVPMVIIPPSPPGRRAQVMVSPMHPPATTASAAARPGPVCAHTPAHVRPPAPAGGQLKGPRLVQAVPAQTSPPLPESSAFQNIKLEPQLLQPQAHNRPQPAAGHLPDVLQPRLWATTSSCAPDAPVPDSKHPQLMDTQPQAAEGLAPGGGQVQAGQHASTQPVQEVAHPTATTALMAITQQTGASTPQVAAQAAPSAGKLESTPAAAEVQLMQRPYCRAAAPAGPVSPAPVSPAPMAPVLGGYDGMSLDDLVAHLNSDAHPDYSQIGAGYGGVFGLPLSLGASGSGLQLPPSASRDVTAPPFSPMNFLAMSPQTAPCGAGDAAILDFNFLFSPVRLAAGATALAGQPTIGGMGSSAAQLLGCMSPMRICSAGTALPPRGPRDMSVAQLSSNQLDAPYVSPDLEVAMLGNSTGQLQLRLPYDMVGTAGLTGGARGVRDSQLESAAGLTQATQTRQQQQQQQQQQSMPGASPMGVPDLQQLFMSALSPGPTLPFGSPPVRGAAGTNAFMRDLSASYWNGQRLPGPNINASAAPSGAAGAAGGDSGGGMGSAGHASLPAASILSSPPDRLEGVGSGVAVAPGDVQSSEGGLYLSPPSLQDDTFKGQQRQLAPARVHAPRKPTKPPLFPRPTTPTTSSTRTANGAQQQAGSQQAGGGVVKQEVLGPDALLHIRTSLPSLPPVSVFEHALYANMPPHPPPGLPDLDPSAILPAAADLDQSGGPCTAPVERRAGGAVDMMYPSGDEAGAGAVTQHGVGSGGHVVRRTSNEAQILPLAAQMGAFQLRGRTSTSHQPHSPAVNAVEVTATRTRGDRKGGVRRALNYGAAVDEEGPAGLSGGPSLLGTAERGVHQATFPHPFMPAVPAGASPYHVLLEQPGSFTQATGRPPAHTLVVSQMRPLSAQVDLSQLGKQQLPVLNAGRRHSLHMARSTSTPAPLPGEAVLIPHSHDALHTSQDDQSLSLGKGYRAHGRQSRGASPTPGGMPTAPHTYATAAPQRAQYRARRASQSHDESPVPASIAAARLGAPDSHASFGHDRKAGGPAVMTPSATVATTPFAAGGWPAVTTTLDSTPLEVPAAQHLSSRAQSRDAPPLLPPRGMSRQQQAGDVVNTGDRDGGGIIRSLMPQFSAARTGSVPTSMSTALPSLPSPLCLRAIGSSPSTSIPYHAHLLPRPASHQQLPSQQQPHATDTKRPWTVLPATTPSLALADILSHTTQYSTGTSATDPLAAMIVAEQQRAAAASVFPATGQCTQAGFLGLLPSPGFQGLGTGDDDVDMLLNMLVRDGALE